MYIGLQEAECVVSHRIVAWRGFWNASAGFKSHFYHPPMGSPQTICLTSTCFLNYKIGVITASMSCRLVSMKALSKGEGGLGFIL